ncbi:MAG TPA: type IV pilus secretin PilQ [Terriglobales bacterium]|nr:type IV pilus secretin PilQ [Terriglobales bacterium]
MRLKQSLGVLLVLTVLVTSAAAGTASQLTNIGVKSQGNATTLTIQANGAFTHTEYRPTDNLLLVDLAGVSAAKLENQSRDLKGQFPGVESYRVVGYKAASGANIARIEIGLAPNAVVGVAEAGYAVAVRVKSDAPFVGKAEAAMEVAAKPQPVKTAKAAPVVNGRPAQIRNVSVVRGKGGLQVQINASSAIAPTAIKLSGPDRIVVDVPNAIPAPRMREIAVNHQDVKGIRVARYALTPPATRIVIDLNNKVDFELASNGSQALVKLHGAQELPLIASAKPMVPQATPPAPSVVAVQPVYTSRPATAEEAAEVKQSPSERASVAASRFATPAQDIPMSNANATMKPQPAMNLAALPQQTAQAAQQQMRMGCTSGRYNGEPISVNLKDVDLRDFFRLIHDISGLNVVLDPQVRGSLTIVLDDVPWDQALAIVLNNNSLECQLDGNVLRIATTATLKKEADDRRAQIEAQALAVEMITINRYLSYAVAKDVAPTMKNFLSPRGSVIADERTNSLIISDIPNVMANVDRQIKELDRKTQEVEIEARVVSAGRSFARELGVQLGFGWNNAATSVLGGSGNNSPIVSSRPFNGGVIPLFSNLGVLGPTSGIGFTNAGSNYRLDAILSMAESRGLAKILSRPRVVTQNNVQAIVKQGQRIPVITGAQLGGPPTVTYFEVLLRLTVKPQITHESTIFLNIDVENTTPDFSRTTAQQPNPVLLTSQATTQVLVSDGGTVMIGGVITTTSNVAIAQVPLLGNIPIFGNLFKRRSVRTASDELLFFITPKIIQT